MKNNLTSISATTPIFVLIIVYLISLFFFLIAVNSISEDIISFFVMGILGVLLLIISLSLLYFKLLSTFIYPRLLLETSVAMSEKSQVLINGLIKQGYLVKEQSPKYILERKADFNLLGFILFFVLGILPGIIYLIVTQEIGNHSISFELNGKVYKNVTVDMSTNTLVYNS